MLVALSSASALSIAWKTDGKIRDPPAPPATRKMDPSSFSMIVGAVEERGRLCGAGKFSVSLSCQATKVERMDEWRDVRGLGGTPHPFGTPGIEKSSISSFRMMPVSGSMTCDPKTRFMEDVIETAIPLESMMELWEVP